MKLGLALLALSAWVDSSTSTRVVSNAPWHEQPSVHVVESLHSNRLIHYVRPLYPEEARRKRIQGTVRLRILITRTGKVDGPEVIEGDPLLAPAAVEAVKRWRYSPCVIDSVPVDVGASLDINFNLTQ